MSERLIERYLRDLRDALHDLPKARQDELAADIRAHIESALAETPSRSEADIRNVLDRLGDPEEIAGAERERLGIRSARAGARETAAVILLPIGGVLIPVIGWIIGLLLLWSSRVWTSRDKWIGSLIIPGGLLLPVELLLFPTHVCSTSSLNGQEIGSSCSDPSTLHQATVLIGFALLVAAPIVTAIYLARRANHLSRG